MGNKRSSNPEDIERKRELDRIRKRQRLLSETDEQREARRRANTASQRRRRENETEEERVQRQAADNNRHILRRADETTEEAQRRRVVDNNSHTARRENETQEERVQRQAADNNRHILRRADETMEDTQLRRIIDNNSHTARRENETQEERLRRRIADNNSHILRRGNETTEMAQRRRAADNNSHAARREKETEEERVQRQAADNNSHILRRANETTEETQRRISAVRSSQIAQEQRFEQQIRSEAIYFIENAICIHNCGQLNTKCQFCGALHFIKERTKDGKFSSCCHKGKIKLQKPKDNDGNILEYPDLLKDLMTNENNPFHTNFMQNIRSYNSAMSFASMGATTASVPGYGPYVFKVQGQTYHRTSHVEPVNEQSPRFAQLYVIDSVQATDERMAARENERCSPQVMQQLDNLLRRINRFADAYHMMREKLIEHREIAARDGLQIPRVSMVFRRDRRSDQRRFNSPTANEIAMIFVNEDGEPPFERDIRIYPKNPENEHQQFINLNILSPNMDPMTYALLFPYGEPGWEPKWQCESYDVSTVRKRCNASMLQYKSALIAIREEFNPILQAGKLFQQWIVDSYLQIEANNLNFIRQKQPQLRVELYQGLADHISSNAGLTAGRKLILPSSFEGSPRNMRERCCDAMAIFGKYGAPDLFITFTANPKWPEIVSNLKPGQQVCDRPDLVARVFRLKLRDFMEDLTKKGVLGKVTAFVYTIEFQKRGLPHAHILLTLKDEDKFKTVEAVDKVVCAEIPDKELNPLLYDAVTKFMIHGPCGAACMENNRCKKQFPKEFNEATILNKKGYPKYRRRGNIEVNVRQRIVDNRFVVPYNPYLLTKYNAHINVEVCTSLKAVKYIYKYIYKGFDCGNIAIHSGEIEEGFRDEITNYVNGRYVSPIEAMHRILEFPMHDKSHAVIRLAIHLPGNQSIVFEEGQEELALNRADQRGTNLIQYFELNKVDVEARNYLYTEIPYHYVLKNGKWEKRKRGGDKVVPRMYTVSLSDRERFYLRILLLHVKGATSFEDLRTVNGTTFPTFQQAASERGLLESDVEWKKCLEESVTFQMPSRMRQTFVFILLYCMPENSLNLWEEFCEEMSLDFLRNNTPEVSYNLALGDINEMLLDHGKTCSDFNLPTPTPILQTLDAVYDQQLESEEAVRLIGMLNDDQRFAFNKITRAVDCDDNNSKNCFFLDGPGGSGKTHLYRTLMSHYRGNGKIVLPFATTGIASTLLKGGRTVHSGFKLPVPLNETSVSFIKHTSPEAENFRKASLIIIDEVTMLQKDGLRCIDAILKEIMKVDKPFGGKVIVIGGDFRQTLPVVPHGTRTDVIETCIKSSILWQHFTKISLNINMRSEGQNEFNEWLLNIGCGTTAAVTGLPEGTIEIPNDISTTQPIVEAIFGDDIEHLTLEDLTKRVILASTNEVCLNINSEIIRQLHGGEHIYYSADSIVSDDPNDATNYPTEFLNSITLSGMPPHKLSLKPGAIVMLIRNLCPKKGLCNGTRLIIRSLQRYSITAEILSECNRGDIINIPRIDLAPSDVNLPFTLKRRQFPLIPAFAVTINKSQGQTYDNVGVFLNEPVFSHGQLYVSLSRSRNRNNIKVYISPGLHQGKLLKENRIFTQNVVYKEIF